MQILQTPLLCTFTFPQNPKSLRPSWRPLLPQTLISPSTSFRPRCFSSDEFPVDETFLESFAPKDKETEDEARRRNWIERGWAPWDEILSYEGDFARKSLNEGEEVALKNPDSLEAYRMMSPKYREEKRKELGLTEEEWFRKRCEIKGEKPEPLSTMWLGPLVLQLVPPRDWPPRGWEVDRDELEFIRGAHKMQAERVDIEDVENRVNTDTTDMNLERYKVFLKQYKEWVSANKDRLEKESYEYDQDYHPGRRKRGKDYVEGMYELPFYYPGQICEGTVTTLHLYQGAFVDIGGVYEGWVPIRGNDWYWLRHHIKVGMHVIVEILAKRDPYRFRFPIEMRFVHPNIDHLIFNRFEFPPIFHRDEDFYPDEILRDGGRPLTPRKRLKSKPEKTTLLSNHPYVDKLWQIHVAEQMIVDDFELNPQKYEGQKLSELSDDDDFDEENSVEYTTTPFQETTIPKVIMKTSVKELDLDSALAERKIHNKLRMEAKERGEEYKIDKLNRNIEMDEYDLMHFRRSVEEREALIRDISCRQALGLPVEEPGRYKDESFFAKEKKYDPKNPLYRYDYWGEPRNSEKRRILGAYMDHHRSIVGKSKPWYKSSYKRAITPTRQEEETDQSSDEDDDEDDDEGEIDIDYINTFLGTASPKTLKKLTVGGLDSKMADDDLFVD